MRYAPGAVVRRSYLLFLFSSPICGMICGMLEQPHVLLLYSGAVSQGCWDAVCPGAASCCRSCIQQSIIFTQQSVRKFSEQPPAAPQL